MKDILLSDWVCMGDPPPPALTHAHTHTVHCTHTPVCSVLPASYCAYTLPLSAPTLSHLSTTSQPCCCMETCCSLIWARSLHRLSASCSKSQSIKKRKETVPDLYTHRDTGQSQQVNDIHSLCGVEATILLLWYMMVHLLQQTFVSPPSFHCTCYSECLT